MGWLNEIWSSLVGSNIHVLGDRQRPYRRKPYHGLHGAERERLELEMLMTQAYGAPDPMTPEDREITRGDDDVGAIRAAKLLGVTEGELERLADANPWVYAPGDADAGVAFYGVSDLLRLRRRLRDTATP